MWFKPGGDSGWTKQETADMDRSDPTGKNESSIKR